MRYSFLALTAIAAQVSAHGVITSIQGANGVDMPGLSGNYPLSSHSSFMFISLITTFNSTVADGTPRDCASPLCGSEADTSIIRARELGTKKASALGRTSTGPVDAAAAIANFMTGTSATSSTGSTTSSSQSSANQKPNTLLPRAGGSKTPKGTSETGVSAAAGAGATSGLPTTSDDGVVTMTYHQVNQDGAGPLKAMIDATSGGTDPSAFVNADVVQDVPGLGIGGLSGATTTDFAVKVQMPQGMTCTGQAGGASNVCVVRVQNSALAGPFGGSAAFTQSKAAKKRAVEFGVSKRRVERGVLGMDVE
jgi:hypothetical protein